MGVHVDESRADHGPAGVDHLGSFHRGGIATDDLDSIAGDGNAGPKPGLSSPVYYPAVFYQKVEHGHLLVSSRFTWPPSLTEFSDAGIYPDEYT
jgi:hypothetical protein